MTPFLLAASLALASPYEPGADGESLRSGALAAHESISRASGLALETEKVAFIKDGLDEGVRRASAAAEAAGRLGAQAVQRMTEMASALKKSEVKDADPAERRRWLRATQEHAELSARVEKLPEKAPDGKPGPDKLRLQEALRRAAGALKSADDSLHKGEDAATAMGAALQKMKDAHRRAQSPSAELAAAVDEAQRRAGLLPSAADEAKERLDLLSQEPRNVSRTRAGEKMEMTRGLAQRLFTAADAAANRSSELHDQSSSFEKTQEAFEKARTASQASPASARPSLEEAEKTLASVRESFPGR
ncbi:MAG: hypothetical protein A2506_01570 [Elusimicrobia bacterium RIFOXYD12_FULL_66_9]|nr:MAG: hypothetical protein A2506_01570 [Elusimicrobia bacterium RIFOXYD12_FULL_66_9]